MMDGWYLKRVESMCLGEGLFVDACSKMLRSYTTVLYPCFYDRLCVHLDTKFKSALIHGKTFTYQASCIDGYSGSNLMNDLFSSFYLQENRDDEEAYIIYPKISARTFMDEDFTDSLSDLVQQWLAAHSTNGMTNLKAVATSSLGYSVTEDLLGDFKNSSLAKGLLNFLLSNEWKFPVNSFPCIANRIVKRDLVMKIKYYPARDDNRAYCQDTNELRQLVGACLNRLLVPKALSVRTRLKTSSMFRHEERDILELRIPVAPQDGFTSKLVLLDISNFTGSFANSWVMLFCMALDAHSSLKYKYNLYGIGETIMVASWSEILILYLYLTVGYPCYVDDLDRDISLPGGFLGINANISTGLLCLAIILKQLRDIARSVGITCHCQIGGDDSAFVLHGRKELVESFTHKIKEDIESFVGLTKIYQVVDLDCLQDGFILNSTFCRKRIFHKRVDGIHWIKGETACPIHQGMLPGIRLVGLQRQVEAWRELDWGLRTYEDSFPHEYQRLDSIRMVYLEKYPYVRALRSKTVTDCSRLKVLYYEGLLVSRDALNTVLSIDIIWHGPIFALQTFSAKLTHALHLTLVVQRKVLYRGEEATLTLLQEQESFLTRSTTQEKVSLQPHLEFLYNLKSILEK